MSQSTEGVKKETTKAASSTLPVAQSASSGSTTICVSDSIADEEVASASTPLGCGLKLRAKKRKTQDSSSVQLRAKKRKTRDSSSVQPLAQCDPSVPPVIPIAKDRRCDMHGGLDEVGKEEDGAEEELGAEEHRAVPTYPAQKNLVQKKNLVQMNIVRYFRPAIRGP